jgi:hypothetical protein
VSRETVASDSPPGAPKFENPEYLGSPALSLLQSVEDQYFSKNEVFPLMRRWDLVASGEESAYGLH